jgi:hypothetical protein
MTSVFAGPKQTNGHFITLSTFALKSYTAGTGSGGSFLPGSFEGASLVTVAPNTLLKDLGQTVVSSLRVFRKVAPVQPVNQANPYTGSLLTTFGVSTQTSGTVVVVGYIELGYEGFGYSDPVARFNNL